MTLEKSQSSQVTSHRPILNTLEVLFKSALCKLFKCHKYVKNHDGIKKMFTSLHTMQKANCLCVCV